MTKPNAYAWYITTPKDDKHYTQPHDQEYFDKLGLQKQEFIPQHVVAFCIITTKQKAVDYMQHENEVTQKWFKETQRTNPEKEYIAYKIDHFHILTKSHKNTSSMRMALMKIDDLLETIKKENEIILQYEQKYKLTHRAIVIDSKMISLMGQRSKTCELRTINYQLIPENEQKTDSTVCGFGPRMKLNRSKVPSRSDIIKKKRKHPNIMKDVDSKNVKKSFGDIFCQQRMIFNRNDMKPEFKWILHKSNDNKNKNASVQESNDRLLLTMEECVANLDYWKGNKLPDRLLSALRNSIDIIATKPQFYSYLLERLKNEVEFESLAAPIAHCFGLIAAHNCPIHETVTTYLRTTDGYDKWLCRKCGKDQAISVWKNSSFKHHGKEMKFFQWLLLIYYHGIEERQKNMFNLGVSERTISKSLKHLRSTLLCYEREYPIKCGGLIDGKKSRAFTDHKEVNKLKYNQGYTKKSNTKIMGTTDECGLFRNDIVSNERHGQTMYMLEQQTYDNTDSTTDQAKCFIGIPNLGENRTHQTVNHSGQMAPGGYITFFKDETTGVDNNAAEGNFGRLSHFIVKNPVMNTNATKFMQYEASYSSRHNRGSNFVPQVFIHCITAYKTIHTPNKATVEMKQYEDFEVSYEVEFIIKRRAGLNEEEYFVKWKGYGNRDNLWIPKSGFVDEAFITNFNKLTNDEKKKRVEKYEISLKKERKTAKEKNKIAGLSITKIKELIKGDKTWKSGVHLYEHEHVKLSKLLKHRWASATVTSQTEAAKSYGVLAEYNKNGDILSFQCVCIYFQNNKDFLCKHLVAILYERLVNKTN